MRPRPAAAAIRATVVAGFAVLGLSGCEAVMNGLFFLETPRVALARTTFDWREDDWAYGPGWGTDYHGSIVDYSYDIRNGYFVSYNGPHYAVTERTLSGDLEVRLEWELWYGYNPAQLDNFHAYDFRIVLDSSDSFGADPQGPAVELKLYDQNIPQAHYLRIREATGPDSAGTSTLNEPPATVIGGTLSAIFERHAAVPTISARVWDHSGTLIMEAVHEVPAGWRDDARVFVEAVGAYAVYDPGPPIHGLEARALDSVFVLRPEADR